MVQNSVAMTACVFILFGALLTSTSGMRSDTQKILNAGDDSKDELITEASETGETQKSGVETENAFETKSGQCTCTWQWYNSKGEHRMPGSYTGATCEAITLSEFCQVTGKGFFSTPSNFKCEMSNSGMRSDDQNDANAGDDSKDELITEASETGETQKSGVETENAFEKKSGQCTCTWQWYNSKGEHRMPGNYTEATCEAITLSEYSRVTGKGFFSTPSNFKCEM